MKWGKKMNVLSLFDGMSCGRLALEKAGHKVTNYFSSEIEAASIAITQKNFPDTIQLGDVNNWREWELPEIDLIIGGSPCQGFSKAGKMLNFEDPRSKLFFEFVKAVEHFKPKFFMLENVAMKPEYRDIMTEYMGVKPIKINSALVSAQKRDRYYWTNIPGIEQPENRNVFLSDILQDGEVDKDFNNLLESDFFRKRWATNYIHPVTRKLVWCIPEATKKGFVEVHDGQSVDLSFLKSKTRRGRLMDDKSNCMTASSFIYAKAVDGWFRKFTAIECERLQTVPDDYTKIDGLSDAQRMKMLGNGWTVDVIAHIFESIPVKVKS